MSQGELKPARQVRSRSTSFWRSTMRSRLWYGLGCRSSEACGLQRGICGAGSSGLPGRWRAGSTGAKACPTLLPRRAGRFLRLYRAVVEAGARSGRLAVALEGLARYVRGYSEARTAIGLALWYPMLIITLAYGLFVGLVWEAVPRFLTAFEALGLKAAAPLHWLSWIGDSASYWWPAGPILLAILAIAWIYSGTAARFHGSSWSWLRIFPWMKSVLANYETAGFSELLALLLEHNVSYPEALILAAEATGNRRMTAAASELAASIVCGEPPSKAVDTIDRRAFLPMLRWVLATGQEQGSLVSALRSLAEMYRKRARFQAQKLSIFLPTILMVVIGASATLLYALALFVPLVNLLRGISAPELG